MPRLLEGTWQSLHGQFTGIHFPILSLNARSETEFLISVGIIFHIFGLKVRKVSIPFGGPMVQWLACLIFTIAIGVRILGVAVKFHNVYDYTIVRHPWQVSENHKPHVHPSHVREIGQPCEGNWAVN